MWNKIAIRVAVLVLGPSLVGCGATAQMIVEKSQSERTDIFQEISRDEAIPAGYAGLAIKASLKTHVAGYYVGESEKSLHGKPGYPFVINIDGQAAVWEVDGQKAVKPAYDERELCIFWKRNFGFVPVSTKSFLDCRRTIITQKRKSLFARGRKPHWNLSQHIATRPVRPEFRHFLGVYATMRAIYME